MPAQRQIVILEEHDILAVRTDDGVVRLFGIETNGSRVGLYVVDNQPHSSHSSLTWEEQELARSGQTIQAIKLVRERTGLGLGEAKALVDDWKRKYL